LYPVKTYLQSTVDENSFESKPFGPAAKGFPYDLKNFIGKNYGLIGTTPHGNTLTAEFAKAAIINEQLGADSITDLLAVSFSSPDLIGHAFGPNSIEQEDDFLRLDKDIADLLNFLDSRVGKNQYLLFLSADHAVAHNPTFLKENKIPAGSANFANLGRSINNMLQEKFKRNDLVFGVYNSRVSLNRSLIDSLNLDHDEIKKVIIKFLSGHPAVVNVFDISKPDEGIVNDKIKKIVTNSYYPRRSGEIQIIIHPQWNEGSATTGASHSTWYPYDAHIPLVWYGWGIKTGKLNREVYMTDITPTLAALLHIQMPNGCVGSPIEELIK
jgi:predicted AlkP superfamily pyrophosphatase or phosphodiesterase